MKYSNPFFHFTHFPLVNAYELIYIYTDSRLIFIFFKYIIKYNKELQISYQLIITIDV